MSNWAGVAQIDHLDQETLEGLARTCTRPRKGVRYKDPQSVKALFKAARVSGSAPAWKAALKARTAARKKWEYERLVRAAEGDWQTFKELRPTKHEGWDVHFAEVQSEDPQSTWLLSMREGRLHRTFEEAELKSALSGLRRGRAVGIDHTSAELLLAVADLPGGLSHLLEWYNRVLTTQVIPKQWNRPVLVLLPKLPAPMVPKDLRPIALGSAVSKVFSKMLMARIARGVAPKTPAQCAAPGRQTGDYLYTLWRLMELSREWGAGFAAIKLDLSKAFDCLSREALLRKMRPLVSCGAEFVCWQQLLTNIEGILQSPWGFVAGVALAEASVEYDWSGQQRVFQGMEHEQMLYMDDGFLWTPTVADLRSRILQLGVVLRRYGLRLNLAKCQLYCSPYCTGPHAMELEGVQLVAVDSLDVMGLKMKVGMSVYELVSPLAARAREKFWAVKYIYSTL